MSLERAENQPSPETATAPEKTISRQARWARNVREQAAKGDPVAQARLETIRRASTKATAEGLARLREEEPERYRQLLRDRKRRYRARRRGQAAT